MLQRLAISTVFSSASGNVREQLAHFLGTAEVLLVGIILRAAAVVEHAALVMQTRTSCAGKSFRCRKRTSLVATTGRSVSAASSSPPRYTVLRRPCRRAAVRDKNCPGTGWTNNRHGALHSPYVRRSTLGRCRPPSRRTRRSSRGCSPRSIRISASHALVLTLLVGFRNQFGQRGIALLVLDQQRQAERIRRFVRIEDQYIGAGDRLDSLAIAPL